MLDPDMAFQIFKANTLIVSALLVLVALMIWPERALAHPGRTDRYGCHTCRTNCPKWGLRYNEYHCHSKPRIR